MATTTTQRRTVPEFTCAQWIYGPQASRKNAKYSVGADINLMWGKTRYDCFRMLASQLPFTKLKYISIAFLIDPTIPIATINANVDAELKESETFEILLLIHSVFIIALGDLIQKLKWPQTVVLSDGYKYFYEEAQKRLENPGFIRAWFVKPESFVNLVDAKSERPRNILASLSLQQINELIKLKTLPPGTPAREQTPFPIQYPIPRPFFRCSSSSVVNDCFIKFNEIEPHPYFKPLVDIISCHCSALKQKLNKTNDIAKTFGDDTKQIEFSKGDYDFIKKSFSMLSNQVLPPIIIRQYILENNVCTKKTYLSQLFEKCCILFYKPTYIKPTTRGELYNVGRDNLLIATKGCSGYFDSHSNLIFKSSIVHRVIDAEGVLQESLSQYSNTPVYFITQEANRIYPDPYCGPVFQFYADVLKELLEYKVFVPVNTLFSNERYVLNMNFDIGVFDFYKEFPDEHKTPEFKKIITQQFFKFVGNLIHFAVANNLELPFKLSRIYIMNLFGLFDFTAKSRSGGFVIKRNIYHKMLLISIYLSEKITPAYQKLYMQIFQNPELLKNPTPELITAFNSDDGHTRIHMNGFNTLTDAPDDAPEFLYKEGDSINDVLKNLIEFLYKTAFKSYFENQLKENNPFNENFNVNANLQMLFEGFFETKSLMSSIAVKLPTLDNSSLSFDQKLSIVRKADIYLSGFGITYETIQKMLIPKIQFINTAYEIKPFDVLKITGNLTIDKLDSIISQEIFTNLQTPVQDLLKKAFLLYKVLLCRGENIPIDFINLYNEKIFNIRVPPQKVKITVVQQITAGVSPSPIRIPEGATVISSETTANNVKVTVIETTTDINISIPRDGKATYEYTPVSSGNQRNMTDEDYHNEFVKYLLKFWAASPNIGNSTYTMSYQSEKTTATATDYVKASTCFLTINAIKIYTTVQELYEDLAKSIIHTGFGETLVGGTKKSKKRK